MTGRAVVDVGREGKGRERVSLSIACASFNSLSVYNIESSIRFISSPLDSSTVLHTISRQHQPSIRKQNQKTTPNPTTERTPYSVTVLLRTTRPKKVKKGTTAIPRKKGAFNPKQPLKTTNLSRNTGTSRLYRPHDSLAVNRSNRIRILKSRRASDQYVAEIDFLLFEGCVWANGCALEFEIFLSLFLFGDWIAFF